MAFCFVIALVVIQNARKQQHTIKEKLYHSNNGTFLTYQAKRKTKVYFRIFGEVNKTFGDPF